MHLPITNIARGSYWHIMWRETEEAAIRAGLLCFPGIDVSVLKALYAHDIKPEFDELGNVMLLPLDSSGTVELRAESRAREGARVAQLEAAS